MSRSGYVDDCDDDWRINLYRGRVTRVMRGKPGQAFLREMAAALDAMPVKELIAHELVEEGSVCAIGAVGLARGVDMTELEADDPDEVAGTFGISGTLAREIVYENDESGPHSETPANRWRRMRAWVQSRLALVPSPSEGAAPEPCIAPHDGGSNVRPHSIAGWWQVWSGGICIALLRPEDVAPILATEGDPT